MLAFDTLCLIAYKKERALARRLAKRTSMTEHEALTQVLERAAAGVPLTGLIAQRRKQQADAEAAKRQRVEAREASLQARRTRTIPRDAHAWHAWFDGSAHPNPGKIGIGALLESPHGETVTISAPSGHGDSCQAEYLALIAVLDAALDLPTKPAKLIVHGDSRVVIDDMLADPSRRSVLLATYACQALESIERLKPECTVELQWIPRARNTLADALSQRAVRGDQPSSRTSTTGDAPNVSPSA
jgi:ribonuclease HI